MKPIWIVDDDESIRWVLEKALARESLATRSFSNARDVVDALATETPQVLVSDIRMPGESGLALLQRVKQQHPGLPVIVMTAFSDLDSTVAAFQGGAFEYLAKPFDLDKAVELIRRALDESLRESGVEQTLPDNPEILGSAAAMQDVFRAIGRLSQSNVTVLITGESGGGKSTLIQLLTRFAEPQSGSIEVGGVALSELDEVTLRQHISCATQFTWAKTATLADNLRLARPESTDEELESVLALVGLHPSEMGWQDGLHTWVEEGGASLSGGQRRRLSIARALLRNAPITLLDEPSEGLDLASERELVRGVTAHLGGRTLVWVSHREDLDHRFDRVIRVPA